MDQGGRWIPATVNGAEFREPDRRLALAIRSGAYMALGLIMSCSRVLEGGAPFGMAMVACAGPGLNGVFTLAGAALGYLISGGVEWGIRYIAAAVLVYTIAFVFQELEIYRSSFFMPLSAGLVMALTGFLGSFSSSAGAIPLAAELTLETALAFGGTYFFKEALSSARRDTEAAELRHSVAVIITAACALMAFNRLVLFNTVSIGRFIALIAVMVCAMKGGMLTGAAAGTVLGLAMDITQVGAPFYTMAYSFSGLLSGVFGKHGRVLFVLSFVLAGALAVVCAWDTEIYISALFETFCASVVFMLLPTWLLNRAGLMLQHMERGSGESGLRRFTAQRVKNLSEAYAQLYETVRRSVETPYNDENIARVFDRAADNVCVRCKNKNRCWNADYMDTLSAMNDATHAMVENGSLSEADLPGFFRSKCTNLPAFVAAVNSELRSLAYRRQLREHISENRTVAWGQYSDMADVLSRVAEELGSINGSEPLAERRLNRYMRSLDIDGEASVYRDGSGRIHVTLESGRLTPLTKDDDWLEKLSSIVGARLCCAADQGDGSSRLILLEAEPLAVSVGIAALKKQGERISGDKGTYFKTDAGVLCVILSDGMGTGDEAARDSAQVVEILEKFLRSGVDPAIAMKILNSVMLLRSDKSWGCATVDLMCVNLFNGDTSFYKYGAAPSYVKSGKNIRRIKGESLAAGLSMGEGIAPDTVKMRLRPGCTAVIATDGVLAETEDGWLKDILEKAGDDMKALARLTVKEAEKRYGAADDMTVVTVRVEERV